MSSAIHAISRLGDEFMTLFGRGIRKILGRGDRTELPAIYNHIPDANFYRPNFSPWLGFGEFGAVYENIRSRTLVSAVRCFLLYSFAQQVAELGGEFWECGTYRGGTAKLLRHALVNSDTTTLRLFDTFAGMPRVNPLYDLHQERDFSDTSLEDVKSFLGDKGCTEYHQGYIPDTFSECADSRISFVHIDLDIYQSISDCLEFVYPRMLAGGILIFDDYAFPTCPGARKATDEFFSHRPEKPIVLPSGQALILISAQGRT